MFSQCEKSVERRTIDTGSPLTILAPKSETPHETIEWYYAVRPPKSKTALNTSFESARFAPDYPGDYDIVAELYDGNNELIHFNTFQYHAIGPTYLEDDKMDEIVKSIEEEKFDTTIVDTLIASIQLDSVIENEIVDTVYITELTKDLVEKKTILNEPQYTIQVFSLPDEQQANAKKDLLTHSGFDSYIISFTHPKFNSTWYRVRVGQFVEYYSADSTAKLLEQKLNIDTWIDKIVR